jgi:hypothetical protein
MHLRSPDSTNCECDCAAVGEPETAYENFVLGAPWAMPFRYARSAVLRFSFFL